MNAQLNFTALDIALQSLNHLFIDIRRVKLETNYEEKRGGYADVQVSTLDSGTPTAVLVVAKTIRLRTRQKEPRRLAFRLARELKIWAGLRHPHILPLIGYYLDDDYKIAVLISEYMAHGDLKDYIEQCQPTWDARLGLVRDLTDGLAYLHDQNPPVRHGDLKMENVLVSADRRGMLADFGLSRALEEHSTGLSTSDGLKGTLRYYSPELIREENGGHSLPSDIWAWGCLFFEALADKIPYAEKKSQHSILRALMNNELPGDVESLPIPVPNLKSLLARCWAIQACERPLAVHCLRVIESALPASLANNSIDNNPVSPVSGCVWWIEVPRLPASVLAEYRWIHDPPPFDKDPVKIVFGIELEGRMFYYARMRSGLLKRFPEEFFILNEGGFGNLLDDFVHGRQELLESSGAGLPQERIVAVDSQASSIPPRIQEYLVTPATPSFGDFTAQGALRVGHLWYLNVHSWAPYSWVVTRAVLLPTQLVLSWPIPDQGRCIVTLDLVHCTEVLSVPSPTHPRGRDDIGSIAAKRQSNMPDYGNLNELLCPFQLIYEDRVERLAVESARERVRWVGAIWDTTSRIGKFPDQATRVSSPPIAARLRTLASSKSRQARILPEV